MLVYINIVEGGAKAPTEALIRVRVRWWFDGGLRMTETSIHLDCRTVPGSVTDISVSYTSYHRISLMSKYAGWLFCHRALYQGKSASMLTSLGYTCGKEIISQSTTKS